MTTRRTALIMTALALCSPAFTGCTSMVDDGRGALVAHEASVDEQWLHVTEGGSAFVVVEWFDGSHLRVLEAEGPFLDEHAQLTPAAAAFREQLSEIDPRLIERMREVALGDPSPDSMARAPESDWRRVLAEIPAADVEPAPDPDCPPDVPVSECA